MITNFCLFIIFICFAFMVMNHRVKLLWFAKGLMCVGMLSILGVMSIPKHHDTIMDILFIVFAFLASYGTSLIYKRGAYK